MTDRFELFFGSRRNILEDIKASERNGSADESVSIRAKFTLDDGYSTDLAPIYDSLLIHHAFNSLKGMKGGTDAIAEIILHEKVMHILRNEFRESSAVSYPDLPTHEDAALKALAQINDRSVVGAYAKIAKVYPAKTLVSLRGMDTPYVVDAISEISKIDHERGIQAHNIIGLNSLSDLYDRTSELSKVKVKAIKGAVGQLSADVLENVSDFLVCLEKTPREAQESRVNGLSAAFKAIDDRKMLDKPLSPAVEKIFEYYKKATSDAQNLQSSVGELVRG